MPERVVRRFTYVAISTHDRFIPIGSVPTL